MRDARKEQSVSVYRGRVLDVCVINPVHPKHVTYICGRNKIAMDIGGLW